MSTRDTLQTEQRSAFERDGVVRLPGVVPPGHIRAMRDCLWDALLEPHGLVRDEPSTWSPGGGLGLSDVSGALRPGPGTRDALDRVGQSAAFEPLEAALGEAVNRVFGAGRWAPVAGLRGGLAAPNFPIRENRWDVPHAAWHADEPTVASQTASWGLLAFAFLDRVVHRGGATMVIAGSHRRLHHLARKRDPRFDPDRAGVLCSERSNRALADIEPWIADLLTQGGDVDDRVTQFMSDGCVSHGVPLRVVEMTGEPGDITLMDPRCLHTVSANVSDRARLVMRMICVRLAG